MNAAQLRNEGASFHQSLGARPVPGNLFTFDLSDPKGVRLIAELSDLQCAGFRAFQPLYNDAGDVGLVMASHRSGALAVFHLAREVFSGDELTVYELRPTAATERRVPALAGAVMTLIND